MNCSRFARPAVLLFAGLLLLSVFGCNERSESVAKVAIGKPAPDFTLQTVDGRSITLSSLRGKVVLVNFWATWCPPCREEMPSMEEMYRNYAPGGLELLAINVEENGPQVLPDFLKAHPHTFPVLMDTAAKVQNSYGVFQFPETYIVDRNGIIVDKVIGAIDWTAPSSLIELNRLLKVKP